MKSRSLVPVRLEFTLCFSINLFYSIGEKLWSAILAAKEAETIGQAYLDPFAILFAELADIAFDCLFHDTLLNFEKRSKDHSGHSFRNLQGDIRAIIKMPNGSDDCLSHIGDAD